LTWIQKELICRNVFQMSSKTIHNRFFLVLLSALLISCVATKNVQKEILVDERFIEITKPDSIQWEKAELFHIKGKLRLFLSDEGVSERASAEFRANGEQTLLNLGLALESKSNFKQNIQNEAGFFKSAFCLYFRQTIPTVWKKTESSNRRRDKANLTHIAGQML
jgi:hypothetical protein